MLILSIFIAFISINSNIYTVRKKQTGDIMLFDRLANERGRAACPVPRLDRERVEG